MNKAELKAKVNELKDAEVAGAAEAISTKFAPILEAVDSLEEAPSTPDVEALKAELEAEKSKSATLQAALQKAADDFAADEEADAAQDVVQEATILSEKERADKSEAKVAKLKASLQALIDSANEG